MNICLRDKNAIINSSSLLGSMLLEMKIAKTMKSEENHKIFLKGVKQENNK
jgi:hypothetical protein